MNLKLEAAIFSYLGLQEGSNRKLGAAKGKITMLANELAEEIGAITAREKILRFLIALATSESSRLDLLKKRFTVGSLYEEGERIFGWWDTKSQIQAEQLPMYTQTGWVSGKVYFVDQVDKTWKSRGFHPAEHLPIIFFSGGMTVNFQVDQSLLFLKHGYALPCQLQWQRVNTDGISCLYVERSIISSGFWHAWKWWDTAKWWYLEKRPELFADLDWWGETLPPQRFEPEDDPYAAVLGGD